MSYSSNDGLPWHIVENRILQEKQWLQNVFDFGLRTDSSTNPVPLLIPDEKMLRQLSILIVSGKLRCREIHSSKINGLWIDKETSNWEFGDTDERHGGSWHRAMMKIVKEHFLEMNFEVTNEPFLNIGRADLGIYKEGYPNLYVEVGSTSLYKTWFNLSSMPGCIFLFIPSVYYALEFETTEVNHLNHYE